MHYKNNTYMKKNELEKALTNASFDIIHVEGFANGIVNHMALIVEYD